MYYFFFIFLCEPLARNLYSIAFARHPTLIFLLALSENGALGKKHHCIVRITFTVIGSRSATVKEEMLLLALSRDPVKGKAPGENSRRQAPFNHCPVSAGARQEQTKRCCMSHLSVDINGW